jgi:hypothetical protein
MSLHLLLSIVAQDAEAEIQRVHVRIALEHYAQWNGSWPADLKDLVERPEGARFWPEGGFLSALPERVRYRENGLDGTKLVRRVELLPKTLTADEQARLCTRYRIARLQAAIRLYRDREGRLPTSLQDAKKFYFGEPPRDGWGNEFGYLLHGNACRISSPARSMKRIEQDVSEETRQQVAALVQKLGSDESAEREAATNRLDRMGESVLGLLRSFASESKDPETQMRLGNLIASREEEIRKREETGETIVAHVFKDLKGGIDANERNGSGTLKQMSSIQVTFKTTDFDGNAVNDYWTADVSGLYRMLIDPGGQIRMTERAMAEADGAPLPEGVAKFGKDSKGVDLGPELCKLPVPKSGYLFRAIKKYRTESGAVEYGQDNGRDVDRFGCCAYPAEYVGSGIRTYIVSEAGTMFWKDTGGEPAEVFPRDPEKEGWARQD